MLVGMAIFGKQEHDQHCRLRGDAYQLTRGSLGVVEEGRVEDKEGRMG